MPLPGTHAERWRWRESVPGGGTLAMVGAARGQQEQAPGGMWLVGCARPSGGPLCPHPLHSPGHDCSLEQSCCKREAQLHPGAHVSCCAHRANAAVPVLCTHGVPRRYFKTLSIVQCAGTQWLKRAKGSLGAEQEE